MHSVSEVHGMILEAYSAHKNEKNNFIQMRVLGHLVLSYSPLQKESGKDHVASNKTFVGPRVRFGGGGGGGGLFIFFFIFVFKKKKK